MDQHNFSNQHPQQEAGQFWGQFSEQWQEILAGYTLGALEPDEMLAVEEYLQEHPEFHATMQRLEETVAGLAYTVPTVTPPATSKATLLARVNADLSAARSMPQVAVPTTASSPVQHSYQPAEPARPATPRTARPRPSTQRRRFSWSFDDFFDFATGWKLATVTASAVLLFFAVTTVQLAGELNNIGQHVATLDATLNSRTAELNTATAQLAGLADLQQKVAQLQSENDQLQQSSRQFVQQLQTERQKISSLLTVSQVVELGGTALEPQAQGTLFVGEDSLVLILHGLRPLPSGQIYQLWLIPAESDPISAGLVQISDQNTTSLTTDVKLTTTSFAVVGLSIEPAGGSEQPTGDIVMLGNRT